LPDAREDVEHAERKWNAAILSRDHEIAAQHLAPEYRLIIGIEDQPLHFLPREEWLAQLPNYRIHRQQLHEMHVSVWGDVAVATLNYSQTAEPFNGRDISGKFLISDVWVRRDGRWLVAERHSSRLEAQAR
jgi:ketosteroid isomerase-like protein